MEQSARTLADGRLAAGLDDKRHRYVICAAARSGTRLPRLPSRPSAPCDTRTEVWIEPLRLPGGRPRANLRLLDPYNWCPGTIAKPPPRPAGVSKNATFPAPKQTLQRLWAGAKLATEP
jgi:hypothetical protein